MNPIQPNPAFQAFLDANANRQGLGSTRYPGTGQAVEQPSSPTSEIASEMELPPSTPKRMSWGEFFLVNLLSSLADILFTFG